LFFRFCGVHTQGKEGSPPARLLRVLEQRAVRCLPAEYVLPSSVESSFTFDHNTHHTQGSGHELVQAFVATCRALGALQSINQSIIY
jgi:hypothetical protein